MNAPITGLHHVTAIAGDLQANVDFYTGLLGLRLVKRTVNFDDPSAYHLYYGDETGTPGTLVTFFAWPGGAARGRVGAGQVTTLTFSVAPDGLDRWQARLERNGVPVRRLRRFDEDVLAFADPAGIPLELVGVERDARPGWTGADLPAGAALRGLHTVVLTVRDVQQTDALLTSAMGFSRLGTEGKRTRYAAGPGGSGRLLDVIEDASAPAGISGAGTVHHVAFRVADDAAEQAMLLRLGDAGYRVSSVRDRNYFRSIYYRERNGVLFEIATDVPGFAHDEAVASLGSDLKLPAQFEPLRAEITASLPTLRLPTATGTPVPERGQRRVEPSTAAGSTRS